MRVGVSCSLILQLLLLLRLCLYYSYCIPLGEGEVDSLVELKGNTIAPDVSPSVDPQPFLPLLAPSPFSPFTNNSVPSLSGLCTLKFSAVQNMMSITATDCWDSFAPYLANVVCCPQFSAILVTLLGQSSKYSGMLALNMTHARNCLSDVEKLLESQGANKKLCKICSIHPANLTEASCPVMDVKGFESIVDSSRLLAACEKIDPVNECCDKVCHNAISDAARKISLNGMSSLIGAIVLPEHSTRIDDCEKIVIRWLASKLDPSSANSILRGLTNCNINKVCPLVFPDMTNVAKDCGNMITNKTACCKVIKRYVSHLREQSFITNLQALNCAALLGIKMQKANVSYDVYDLCHINLKDFSLQAVGSKESGCLLPSLPSDVTYDKTSGVGFICDLNDNIAAPWPSDSSVLPSSCSKTTKLPALPAATSSQSGLYVNNLMLPLLFIYLPVLKVLT